jgi:hypothetical protein
VFAELFIFESHAGTLFFLTHIEPIDEKKSISKTRTWLKCKLGLQQLVFVLLQEAFAHGEEFPIAVVVFLPNKGLLAGIFCLVLVDQMLQEKPATR